MTDSKTDVVPQKSQTYPAGCHCGYIKFDVTLRPPLDEQKVMECNCSMCRRGGYLLVCKTAASLSLSPYVCVGVYAPPRLSLMLFSSLQLLDSPKIGVRKRKGKGGEGWCVWADG